MPIFQFDACPDRTPLTPAYLKNIIKFADNTTLVELISHGNETAYREKCINWLSGAISTT